MRPCSTCRKRRWPWLLALMITDGKNAMYGIKTHLINTNTMAFLKWTCLCLMLNSAVNRTASVGSNLVSEVPVWRPADDSWHGGRFPEGPVATAAWILWGSSSADHHRFLLGLPDIWWLTREDTCWLQVKSGLVQNRTWLTRSSLPFCFLLTILYPQLVFLLLSSSFLFIFKHFLPRNKSDPPNSFILHFRFRFKTRLKMLISL